MTNGEINSILCNIYDLIKENINNDQSDQIKIKTSILLHMSIIIELRVLCNLHSTFDFPCFVLLLEDITGVTVTIEQLINLPKLLKRQRRMQIA